MQQRIRLASSPDRHHQSISNKLCRHRCAHRPPHNTAREEIDDGLYIEPAFRCPNIGEVSDPFAVWCGRFEAAVIVFLRDGEPTRHWWF